MLRRTVPPDVARWAKREQFHLTLRFLGSVASDRLEELQSKLGDACRTIHPMQLEAGGMGFFPEKSFPPRVLWVGLQDCTNQIATLYAAVQNATAPFTSEPPQTQFSAHITLARFRQIRRSETERLKEAIAGFGKNIFGRWTANEVHLMRSQLSPSGAQHTLLARFTL